MIFISNSVTQGKTVVF